MLANAVWRAFLQNLSNYESSFLTSTFKKKKKIKYLHFKDKWNEKQRNDAKW